MACRVNLVAALPRQPVAANTDPTLVPDLRLSAYARWHRIVRKYAPRYQRIPRINAFTMCAKHAPKAQAFKPCGRVKREWLLTVLGRQQAASEARPTQNERAAIVAAHAPFARHENPSRLRDACRTRVTLVRIGWIAKVTQCWPIRENHTPANITRHVVPTNFVLARGMHLD